jgi:hypothetical protein
MKNGLYPFYASEIKRSSQLNSFAMENNKFSFHKLTLADLVLTVLCFAVGLTIFISTLAPGLLRDDSAEFQTLAYTLGMTHATGYPVYIFLAKAFTRLIPVRNIAYRVNLLSAVLGAVCMALVYLAGRTLVGWRLPAVAGSLVIGLDRVFWSQAIIAELYTASAALVAAEFVLLFAWRRNGKWSVLFAAGLLGGLSLGVHNTVALAAPAIILYLLISAAGRRDWLAASGGAALGMALALAAYLLLDAWNVPSSYFNSVARPSLSVWGITPQGFESPFQRLSFLYTAYQFRRFMLDFSVFHKIFNLYIGGIDPMVFVLAGLGLLGLIWRKWREALLIAVAYAVMIGFALTYSIFDVYVFFIPTLVPLVLLMASGLGGLMYAAGGLVARLHAERWSPWVANIAGLFLLALVISPRVADVQDSLQEGVPVFLSSYRLDEMVYPTRTPDAPHQEAKAVVDRVEDNAIVFTNWDLLYTFYYVADVEEGRTGIAFHETFPQDGVTKLAASVNAYIDSNLGKRPIYTTEYSSELTRYYSLKKADSVLKLYKIEPRP